MQWYKICSKLGVYNGTFWFEIADVNVSFLIMDCMKVFQQQWSLYYVLTAAISKVHLSGVSIFFRLNSCECESTFMGQLASGAKYSYQISSANFLTWVTGNDFMFWTASQNLKKCRIHSNVSFIKNGSS